MSKLIVLAALASVLLIPGTGQAATGAAHGVVVAKEAGRHVLVVASPGKVTSVRVAVRQFGAIRLGSRVAFTGTALADGSIHATQLHKLGRVAHARLRVTILKIQRAKLLVAGGGTAFAIRLTSSTHVGAAARSGLHPGEQIETDVELGKNGATGTDVQSLGASVLIDFSGKITALDATSVTVADDGVSSVIAIPDGVVLPPLVQVGSEVEIVASISGAALTLVEIKLDGGNSGDGGGSSVDGAAQVHVEGFVSALDTGSVTIQPGDNASPVTFAIPDGFTLPGGLASGSEVEARGSVVDGVLTLSKIELQGQGSGDSTEVEMQGTVSALDAGSITIQPEGDGPALTFAIPDGFSLPSGLQVGALVSAKGETVNTVLTLTKLELDGSGDGGGGGGGDG
ncbi:MAG TPA: hypothetical protein VMU72_03990 [Gaiellaceae bacterium]|nr:hypothetical protein [Gaiellaceae bacterium]